MAGSPLAILERDTPRRIIFVLLLAGAAGLLWWATQDTRPSGGQDGPTRDAAIEEVFPTDGSEILRQAEAGIDLVEGYRAELSANGTSIPPDQITGVDSDGQPSLARYSFSPGAGQVIETWRTGQNCMTATYWPADAGRGQSTVYTWCWDAA